MSGPIVVLGIYVADCAFRADRMPRPGETLMGKRFLLGPGGKGSNQAVASAQAGGETHFITRLGEDPFGDMARDIWRAAGVAPVLASTDGETGAAFVHIDDATGENAIIVCPGIADKIGAEDVAAAGALIDRAAVFMTQLEQPLEAAMAGLARARAADAITILNPAPARDLPTEIYPLCDFMTPNETEVAMLTGVDVTGPEDAARAAEALRGRGVGAAVITLGAAGVYFQTDAASGHVPAFDVGKVVDTTGAGDAFNGGFAVALAEGRPLEDAVRFGCATAGLAVTRPGTARAMPMRAEIDALLDV